MREGWIKQKIKDICAKGSSNIIQSKLEGITGDYAVYGASGFVQNVDFYHQDKPYIGIVKDGSGVGRVNVYPAYSSVVGTLQYILPKDNNLLEYVAYALRSKNLSSFAAGAAIPHIYFKDYGECELMVPPLSIQQQIVSELDLLSHILDQKRQQLKEYDALAESIFYEMFGDGELNSKGWEKKKLEELCSIITDGEHNTPQKCEQGIFLLSARNVQNHYLQLDDVDYIGDDEYNRIAKRIVPQYNDILVSCSGSVGRVCRVPENLKFQLVRSVALLRFKKDVEPCFMEYMILSRWVQEQIENSKTQSSQANLFQGKIKKLRVFYPPLSIQRTFAAKIQAIEQQKQLLKESIKETETLFQSRMDYWFNS